MNLLKPFKNLGNFKLVNTAKSLVVNDKVKIAEVQKLLDIQQVSTSSRPNQNLDRWTNESVLAQQYFPYDDYAVYELYLYSTELRIAIGHVNRETLRNGYKITPRVEFPSEQQKIRAEEFIARANGNNQSLQEVSLSLGKDVDIFDDMFGVLAKDYYVDEKGDIMGGEVQEFFRVSPIYVDFLFSKDLRLGYDYNGKKIYFEMDNRENLSYDSRNKKTGLQNVEAHFRIRSGSVYKYYNSSEIVHASLHEPSLTRGHSPVLPLYNKVMSLLGMDYTIEKYYDKNERQPRSLLLINTTNYDSVSKWWEKMRDKVRRNPTALHPVPVNNADGKKLAEFIDMMKGLSEMQYTEVREEIRRTIGAFYGVSNVFLNDTSVGGGLNNEGLQIKVTNRAVEVRQRMWNEKVLPWIFDQMGITDWEIELDSSKEEDQTFEQDMFSKDIDNAKKMLDMGVEVKFIDGEFQYKDGDLTKAEPMFPVMNGSLTKSSLGGGTSGASNTTFTDKESSYKFTSTDNGHSHAYQNGSKKTSPNAGHTHTIDWEKGIAKPAGKDKHTHRIDNIGLATEAEYLEEDRAQEVSQREDTAEQVESKTVPETVTKAAEKDEPVPVVRDESPVNEDVPKTEQEQFYDNLKKELAVLTAGLGGKKLTKAILNKFNKKAQKELEKRLKNQANTEMTNIYRDAARTGADSIGEKYKFDDSDKKVLNGLKSGENYKQAFANLSEDTSNRLRDAIEQSVVDGEIDPDKLQENLESEVDASESQLKTIIRTETTKISEAASLAQIDKVGRDKFTFEHVGPDDNRTTNMSKGAKRDTSGGVDWPEYLASIEKNKVSSDWVVDPNAPITHPNTRHRFRASPKALGED